MVKIIDQVLGIQLPLMHGTVIDADRFGKAALDSISRHLGPVKTAFDIQAFIHIRIDTHAQPHPAVEGIISGQADGGIVKDQLIVLAMGAVGHKGISLTPAHDTIGIRNSLPDTFTDPLQDLVTVGIAEALIDHMEMVDIHHDGVHGLVFMVLIILLRIAVKKLPVVKTGEGIPLCGHDDLPVLRQLDGFQDTGHHDPGLGIGLWNIINGAQRQAFDLRILVCGQYDHRDVLQLWLCL